MVDSVVWAQYINVTDRHTDRHVAVSRATPTHCVWRQHMDRVTERHHTPSENIMTPALT